jgi:hypothetical protein
MRRAASRPPRPLLAAALAALCLAGVAGLAHAQAKKATGTSSQVVRVARTELLLGNNPADTGRLESPSRVLASSDPDWNGARVFSVRFSDPFMRQERQARGHMVVTHPGGDQAFLEYHFRWKPSQGGLTEFDLQARFVPAARAASRPSREAGASAASPRRAATAARGRSSTPRGEPSEGLDSPSQCHQPAAAIGGEPAR